MNAAGVVTDVASQQIAPSPPLAAVPYGDGGYRSGRLRRRARHGSRRRVRDRQGHRCRRFERPWQLAVPSARTWFAAVGVASFSTALPCIVFVQILRRPGATNAMLLIPVTTIVLGYLVLGESISPRESSVHLWSATRSR
jgi:hypothetical protein